MNAPRHPLLPAVLLSAAQHDIRGLLHTLELGAGSLRMRAPEGSPFADVADVLDRTTDRLTTLLTELIETAADVVDGGPATGPVDVVAVVRTVLADHGIEPITLQTGTPLLARTNAVLLRHLLANLVANAVSASGTDAVRVSVTAGPDRVRIRVRNRTEHATRLVRSEDDDVLHTDRGRGLVIAEVLAAAAGLGYEHRARPNSHEALVTVPDRIRHPSTAGVPDEVDLA